MNKKSSLDILYCKESKESKESKKSKKNKESNNYYTLKSKCSNDDKERIKKLRIPPNWQDVKISKDPSDKVQVTGIDSKNRKQYIYHPLWVQFSKDSKYQKVDSLNFNKFYSVIKKKSKEPQFSKDNIISNMFILMKDLNIRVGNEIYLQENDSVGLTTMSKKHFKDDKLIFIGKKGVLHEKKLNSEHIKFLKLLITIPGKNLFRYYDTISNTYIKISSNDMNDFLKKYVDSNMTTKDIRTHCANIIYNNEYNKLIKEGLLEKKAKTQAVKYTAEQLGNTPKVCRDSYINFTNYTDQHLK